VVQVGNVDSRHLRQRDEYSKQEEQVPGAFFGKARGEPKSATSRQNRESAVLRQDKIRNWPMTGCQQQAHQKPR